MSAFRTVPWQHPPKPSPPLPCTFRTPPTPSEPVSLVLSELPLINILPSLLSLFLVLSELPLVNILPSLLSHFLVLSELPLVNILLSLLSLFVVLAIKMPQVPYIWNSRAPPATNQMSKIL
jgi:hypothetical protein